MKTHVEFDPGIRLNPKHRRLLWIIIVLSILIAGAFALSERTGSRRQ